MTHIGKVREINEDSALETGNLFAVADGMGGHQAGEVASSLALSVIGQYVEDNLGIVPGENLTEKAISAANAVVYQKASSSARFRNMGTTVTLLYREGDTAYIGHVGDSRAYLFRGGMLQQLTRDHSLVAKLVEDGEITGEQAASHPQRNIILKALGLEPRVEVDVVSVKIQPGDEFLLATDGLMALVEDPVIGQVLSEVKEPTASVKRLVDLALEAGAPDNVSAVLVSFEESPTVVPVGGARDAQEPAVPGEEAPGEAGGRHGKALVRWLIVGAVLVVLIGAGFGVGFYFYNRTYFVGARGGKVALFHGFPFWGFATVEKETDIEVKFLPEARKRKVESNLEPESRENALGTIESLREEVEKNSVLVPDVLSMIFEQAREALEKVGLQARTELVSRPTLKADVVITQYPQPGTRVGKGSTVKLQVVMAGKPGEV